MTKHEIINVLIERANSIEKRFSEKTLKTYLQYITKFIDVLNKDISEATERDIRRFLSEYNDKAECTYNLVISSLTFLFETLMTSYLVDEDYISINPMANIKRIANPKKKKKSAITKEDFEKLVAIATNKRDKALLILLAYTGMREDEMINITLEQYQNRNADNGIMLTHTKGSKNRMCYLHDRVIKAIDDYLTVRKDGCEFLFTSNTAKKLLPTSVFRTFKNLAKKADIDNAEDFSPHALRHSFISWNIADGANIEIVATAVGHSSSNITSKIYVDRDLLDVKGLMVG